MITSDNVHLAVRADGPALSSNRVPILLLNGLFGDMPFWDDLVTEFSPQHTCIRMDHRGIGESDRFDAAITYERHAQDVVEVLDHLGVEKVHIVGLCHGGMVGAALARDFPERLSRFCCFGTRLITSVKVHVYESMRIAVLERDGLAAMANLQAPLIFGEQFLAECRPWLDAIAKKNEIRTTPAAAKELLSACRDFAMSPEELSSLRTPALFLAGEEDTYSPPWLVERGARLWPGAQFHILPACGHIATREATARFHREIREFLLA